MSLQIWLPLNGNLKNQGLYNNIASSNGDIAINTSGKIGSCYYFDGTNDYIKGEYYATNTMSFCLWVKFAGSAVKSAHLLDCRNTGASTGYQPMYITASSIQIGGTNSSFPNVSYTWTLNTWYHIAVIYSPDGTKLYINGNKVGTSEYTNTSSKGVAYNQILPFMIASRCNNSNYQNCYVNDLRIYDHCLSEKEIKELSEGLILHYKLNENIQLLDNCYSYPSFNTSDANGGWSHWGQSGASGSQGQNTDKNYIYHKNNTYSHWWANATGATGDYLLYQSPAFSGGYRSLQAILKEENSKEIVAEICYPRWNAQNGGVQNHQWTSVTSLGNGFYLCKVDGLKQDGSNDLVGLYVKPGYKVYASEIYLENDKEICSDIFNQSNLDKIYDTSGYGHNGVINGDIVVAPDTPRYLLSKQFINGTDYIESGFSLANMPQISISFWVKPNASNGGYSTAISNKGSPTGFWIATNCEGCKVWFYNGKYYKVSGSLTNDEWHHCCLTFDNGTFLWYINGQLQTTGITNNQTATTVSPTNLCIGNAYTGTSWNTKRYGNISDVRIYATALNAAAVKELYETSASIDDEGNGYARELVEI